VKVTGIAFTMYPVKDMARARKFYTEVLGLVQGKNFADQWVEYYLDNGCLAITDMTPVKPDSNAGGSIAFEVENLDEAMAAIAAAKVTVKVPIFHSPVCRMAVVLDPEGNAVTLHEKKPV